MADTDPAAEDLQQRGWKRYEELRPDELAELVQRTPVAFWPLGLIEHHGWHLPVGYDGLKAEQLCRRIATRTGGVILPVMWWGAGGGHDRFLWTHYQDPAATAAVLTTTARQLLQFGFRVLLLVAGHYPWQGLLDEHLPPLQRQFANRLLLWGTEVSLGGDAVKQAGDHAAREETSYGLALFPHLVEQGALSPGRGDSAWPEARPPPEESRHPGVCASIPQIPCLRRWGRMPARLRPKEGGGAGPARRTRGVNRPRLPPRPRRGIGSPWLTPSSSTAPASHGLLEKLGFRREGVLRDYEHLKGRFVDMAMY